jgi:DNA polymerase epsilon subunit 3
MTMGSLSISDILLPTASVMNVLKPALSDGVHVKKEARSDISKAASIFILCLTSA